MLNGWFSISIRQPCPYKFEVKETTEKNSPNLDDSEDEIINNFSKHLLLAHGDPAKIKQDCEMILEDLQKLNLDNLKNFVEEYIERDILPSKPITLIGNFGEIL